MKNQPPSGGLPASSDAAPGEHRGSLAAAFASSMRAAHVELATRWLSRLHDLLPVPITSVFPSASLLDHIPDLIDQIADDLVSGSEQAFVANASVIAKAQELGELRYRQRASVHQLLREYRLLADVLNGFVAEELARLGMDARGHEALAVSARLHEAIFVLMQTTVDTFVSRYAETVQRQTGQLEGFNRMLTHEIRQPLGTIRSAVELLRRSDTPSDRRDRCAELIETNCVRMAALTTRLLTLSSLDVDSLHTQEADLKKLAEDAVDQLKDMAAQKAVTVRCDVPSILLFTAVARLELILVNLLSNAIKYSDPKKTVRFVELSAEQQSESVLLCVRDNGIGIPPDTRGRIFDGFYRAHASRDGELQTDGVGLGLAIVMECARHLGATVSVESEDGTGTTFTVQVPLHATIEPLPMRAEG